MPLSEQAQQDLHRLALERVEDAIASISQLLDDDQQVGHLMVHVAVASAFAAATYLHETVTDKDGNHMPLEMCRCKILQFICEASGFESKVVTGDEAKRAGFKQ